MPIIRYNSSYSGYSHTRELAAVKEVRDRLIESQRRMYGITPSTAPPACEADCWGTSSSSATYNTSGTTNENYYPGFD